MKGTFSRKTIAIALALGLAGTSGVLTSCSKKDAPATTESQAAEATPTGTLQFDVHANQDSTWTPDSSPLIAHIESAESEADSTDAGSTDAQGNSSAEAQTNTAKAQPQTSFYHAIKPAPNGSGRVTDTVTVPAGSYRIRYITPVNHDGSAFAVGNAEAGKPSTGTSNSPAHQATVTPTDPVAEDAAAAAASATSTPAQPEENQPAEPSTPAQGEGTDSHPSTEVPPETTTPVDTPIDHVPADQVTDGELQEIVENTGTAIENGDDSLKGDNGKDAVTKVEEGVKNNPNASEGTKGSATETKDTAPVDQPAVQPEQPKPATGGNTGNTGNQPAVQPEQPKPQPQPEQPKPQPQPEQPKQPVCTTVTEYETYTDYETRTERVLVRAAYVESRFAYDGFVTTDDNVALQHQRELALAGHPSNFGTRSFPAQYETRTTQVPVQKTRPVQKQVCK